MSWTAHFLFTIFLIIITAGIVLVLVWNNQATGATFALLVDLVGGISGAMLAFVIPGIIYLNLSETAMKPSRSGNGTMTNTTAADDSTNTSTGERQLQQPQIQPQQLRQHHIEAQQPQNQKALRIIWLKMLSYFNIAVGVIVMVTIVIITAYTDYLT